VNNALEKLRCRSFSFLFLTTNTEQEFCNMDNANNDRDFQPDERAFFNWFARYDEAASPSEYQIRLNEMNSSGQNEEASS